MKCCILFVLLLPVVVYAQTKQEEWKTVSQPDFSVQYPSGWTLDDSGQYGTKYLFFSPLESAQDVFRDNVNVMVQDITGHNLNLMSYAKLSEDQIKSMMTNSKIIESKPVTRGEDTFHRISYTADQGQYHLKLEQYYFVKNNKAYVLTLTCEQDQFEKFRTIGEKILNSFQLSK